MTERITDEQIESMAAQADRIANKEASGISIGAREDIFSQQVRAINAAKLRGVALGLRMSMGIVPTEISLLRGMSVVLNANPGSVSTSDDQQVRRDSDRLYRKIDRLYRKIDRKLPGLKDIPLDNPTR